MMVVHCRVAVCVDKIVFQYFFSQNCWRAAATYEEERMQRGGGAGWGCGVLVVKRIKRVYNIDYLFVGSR